MVGAYGHGHALSWHAHVTARFLRAPADLAGVSRPPPSAGKPLAFKGTLDDEGNTVDLESGTKYKTPMKVNATASPQARSSTCPPASDARHSLPPLCYDDASRHLHSPICVGGFHQGGGSPGVDSTVPMPPPQRDAARAMPLTRCLLPLSGQSLARRPWMACASRGSSPSSPTSSTA